LHLLPSGLAVIELGDLGIEEWQDLVTEGVEGQLEAAFRRVPQNLRVDRYVLQGPAAQQQVEVEDIADLRLGASGESLDLLLGGDVRCVVLDRRGAQRGARALANDTNF